MKNKTILSLSIWLLVVFLSAFYFISQKNKEEENNSAVEKSSRFIEKQISYRQNEILSEQYTDLEETGLNARDLAVYNPIKQNLDFSDSLYETNDYEWKYLQNYVVDSFYSYAQLKKDDVFLNSKGKKPLLKQLHKLALYRLYSKYNLMDFNKIGCNFGSYYSKYQLLDLFDRAKIGFVYDYEKDLATSEFYQENKKIEKISFDLQKDAIIHFEMKTDYYRNGATSVVQNYQLKIKAGQRNDFEIKEVK